MAMTRARRGAAIVAAGIAVAMLSTGCAAVGGVEVLGNGEVCMSMPRDADARGVIGNDIDVTGPVSLDRVELVDAEGLELVEAYVLSMTDEQIAEHDNIGGIGSMSLGTGEEYDIWDLRQPLEGAELRPGTTASILAVLGRSPEGVDEIAVARASALRLYYTARGTQQVSEGTLQFTVAEDCSTINDDDEEP